MGKELECFTHGYEALGCAGLRNHLQACTINTLSTAWAADALEDFGSYVCIRSAVWKAWTSPKTYENELQPEEVSD